MYFKRPEWDKFMGADDTFVADTLMPDGKRNQLGSTHDFGQKFSKAYNIKEKFTGKLNTIDFTIDRYTIDRRSSQHWDYTSEEWLTGAETSFDESGTETLFDGGSTRFISKADTYVSDDRFDKYVLYPKHNIIGNEDYITNG